MPVIDAELLPRLDPHHVLMAWMLAAFLVTFLVTRLVVRAIRTGRGPFRDASVGGVHVHHQVYGIFLLLVTGVIEFAYQPDPPWVHVLAVLFGTGAALTLDEFALWLRLDDVYWTEEGRTSIDAVFIALVVGGLLLVGANPFDAHEADGEPGVAAVVLVNLVLAFVTVSKGRVVLGVLGVFIPLVAAVGALRLARPHSPWARRWYRPGSRTWHRSRERFPPGRRTRWDAVVDLFTVVPPAGPVVPPARQASVSPPARRAETVAGPEDPDR